LVTVTSTHILDAKYKFNDIKDGIDQQTHCCTQQKQNGDLLVVLHKNAKYFM